MTLPSRSLLLLAAGSLAAGGAAWYGLSSHSDPSPAAPASARPDTYDAVQLKRLGIALERARPASAVPLGSVPGTVTLPPEARVAVTSPFAGTAVQVFVVPGQQVQRGEALAVVRAPETVQFGADLARADADLVLARSNAARLDLLAREGVIAGVRADEARAALRRTEATSRENRRLLGLAGAASDGTITLRAPISGRVASVAIDPGTPVGAGAAAPFVIENDAELVLDLQLPERLAGTVRPGMAITLPDPAGTAPAGSGRIVSVAPSLDPQTRSVAARATLTGPLRLLPGKGVTAIISAEPGARRAGVVVPSGAVTRIGDADFVFVHAANRFSARRVTLVANAGGEAVLSDGLAPGESVAVSGVAELKALVAGR